MLVTLASSTTAMRIKRYLEKEGISARIVQTPKVLSRGGCGYSLLVPESAKEKVLKAAAMLTVRVRGMYREEYNGTTKQYVSLIK